MCYFLLVGLLNVFIGSDYMTMYTVIPHLSRALVSKTTTKREIPRIIYCPAAQKKSFSLNLYSIYSVVILHQLN
jgi:hypothetical protein